LHEFCVIEFVFPYLNEESKFRYQNIGSEEKSFVKASFISESLFAKLTSKIFSLSASIESKHDFFVFCLLTYRLGCRGSELIKLRLIDIEESDQLWMYIKNNSFGDNKSFSGLRKLPITLFLTKSENDFFKKFYFEKKQMCRNPKKSLLFSSAINENIPLKYNELSQVIKSIFREITSLSVSFNSLRHSAISRFQLIFDADLSIINKLTIYSDSQVKAIQKVFGSLNKDKFFNISALAGHITPEVTFMHYMHFTDLLLGSKLTKMNVYFSKVGLQNLSGLSNNKITRLTKNLPVNAQQYSVHSIEPFVSHKLAEYCRKNKRVYSSKNKPSQPFELILSKSITAEKCYKALKKVEHGVTVDDVSLAFKIDAALIKKWLEKASILAQLKTSKGKVRLFPSSKNSEGEVRGMAPIIPTSLTEQNDAGAIIYNFRKLYIDDKENLLWCIKYFIHHVTASSAAITFSNKDYFYRFIEIMKQAIPLTRFYIKYTQGHNCCFNKLSKYFSSECILLSPDHMNNVNRYPDGRFEVFFKHPYESRILIERGETEALYSKFSSNSLRYVFHILAIMLLTPNEIVKVSH
jgi:integrase